MQLIDVSLRIALSRWLAAWECDYFAGWSGLAGKALAFGCPTAG